MAHSASALCWRREMMRIGFLMVVHVVGRRLDFMGGV